MVASEAAVETTVLKGMIEVVVAVATTGVMSNPASVRVHVRRIRVSLAVTEGRVVAARFRRSVRGLRTVGRDESASTHVTATTAPLRVTTAALRVTTATPTSMTATTAVLRKRGDRIHEQHQ
jgi:hypothetical protein